MNANYLCVWLFLLLSIALQAQDLENLKNEKPVKISGSVSQNFQLYKAWGAENRNKPFISTTSGNLNLQLYGISIPVSFTIGNQERSFNQPFNQFGMSPTYKWIKLHVGYRNITFSPYTLSGITFSGVGVELNPGKFRFGAMYGRFNRKAIPDSIVAGNTGTFRRTGYSVKVGVGTERNHFDFIVLKAVDDTSGFYMLGKKKSVAPAENLVLGIASKFQITKALSFTLNASGSAFTRDITADTIKKMPKIVEKVFTVRPSTQFLSAAQALLLYKQKNYNLKLQYNRVDPDYKSMGISYIQGDIENITAGGGFFAWKRRISVNGNLGRSHDNLRGNRKARTERTIGSLSVSFNPTAVFGTDIQITNYGISQQKVLASFSDTFKVYQNNRSISWNNRYSIIRTNVTHTFMFLINYQALKDLNTKSTTNANFNSYLANLGYVVSQNSGFSSGANLTYNISDAALQKNKTYGLMLNASKSIDKKVNIGFNHGWNFMYINGLKSNTVMNTGLNVYYNPFPHNSLNFGTSYISNKYSKTSTAKGFDEVRVNLTYSYNF